MTDSVINVTMVVPVDPLATLVTTIMKCMVSVALWTFPVFDFLNFIAENCDSDSDT
jgi:hypothetical protein